MASRLLWIAAPVNLQLDAVQRAADHHVSTFRISAIEVKPISSVGSLRHTRISLRSDIVSSGWITSSRLRFKADQAGDSMFVIAKRKPQHNRIHDHQSSTEP
ncbi:hypothetical protein [Synechococcus sp. MIT S9510]|uniref:hypothetical protein n=1 Tax=unclassified Synechococcus TaxID=2626047 RepID=UPI0039AF56F0